LGLRKFFAANPGLEAGDKVRITEVVKGKKYRLAKQNPD
jgi:hypothetical protein